MAHMCLLEEGCVACLTHVGYHMLLVQPGQCNCFKLVIQPFGCLIAKEGGPYAFGACGLISFAGYGD